MPFSDGGTEARKMISLGKEPSLEVRSVTSEQGWEGMEVKVNGVCECREREEGRGYFSFCLDFEEWAGTRALEEEDLPP